MPPAVIIAGAALAVSAVGTYASIKQGKKALKEQKAANRFERQKSELQSARQKTQAIREARQAYANAQQAGENQGVGLSSAAQGGQASIASQLEGNLSFLDQYGYFSDQAAKHMGKANEATAKAGMWGDVAQLGFQVYGMTSGIPGLKKK